MDEKEPTQRTRPAKGEPIEIPVPTRDEVFAVLEKSAQPLPEKPKRKLRRGSNRAGK
jgi:hypothetical protein